MRYYDLLHHIISLHGHTRADCTSSRDMSEPEPVSHVTWCQCEDCHWSHWSHWSMVTSVVVNIIINMQSAQHEEALYVID